MPEVPKIVHSRLRAGASSAGHPDPDLLTAFVEQALSPAEREGVLQHLAACGDCREVIAIALPASESVFVPQGAPEEEEAAATPVRQQRPRTNWFGWLGLRGAAVAAGVILVASVLILRPGKQPQSKVENTAAAVNTQAAPPMAETAIAKPAAPSVDQQLTASLKTDEVMARKAGAGRAKLESQFSKELKVAPPPKATEMARMQPGFVLGESKRADLDAADKRVPAADAVSVGAVSETVEVSAAAPALETKNNANEDLGLVARNMQSVPIEKAKAPVQTPEASGTAALRTKKQASGASSNYAAAYENSATARSTTWQLSEGALERSLSGGSGWQTVLHPDHLLLCHAARGNDIWAGGQAGTLFHSTDGGATWTQLHPMVKDRQLTADITGIELQKPGEAALTVGSGESWITMDNGKTWAKK